MGGPVGTPGRFFVMEGFREAERRGGVLPRPGAFRPLSLSLSPTGYFLSRKKVTKERFKERGISISPFP